MSISHCNSVFQTSGADFRVNPKDFRELDWLFPETTKNFNKLPLQYKVSELWFIENDRLYPRVLLPALIIEKSM